MRDSDSNPRPLPRRLHPFTSTSPPVRSLFSSVNDGLIYALPEVAAALTPFPDAGVVLDEAPGVWRSGRLDLPRCRTRLRSGPARVRELVVAPTACVVFGLLAHHGIDLRERPYRKRCRRLEKLMARGLPID